MTPDISLLIPFLNEQDNIPRLVAALNTYLATWQAVSVEVLFVDDGSIDHSVEILKNAPHQSYTAKIVQLSKNYGSHAALRAGIWHAAGQRITFLPADLQDPLELLEKLYAKSLEGYDIVWAARRSVDVSFLERSFSKVYGGLMRKFAVSSYPVNGFDVVMFNENVKQALNQNIEANSSIFLQILTLGFRCASISYDKHARSLGQSKWTLSKKIKLFIDSFVAFSYAPIRFVSIMGVFFSLMGFAWTAYLIGRTLLLGNVTPGWPALVSILFLGFGVTNIGLGIVAEYLWRTLDAARKRPVFLVDEIIALETRADAIKESQYPIGS